MSSNIVEVKNLSVNRSELFTLSVQEFTMQQKSVIGLVGNNGAGKTTFLQSLLNLLECSFDTLQIFSLDWMKNAHEIKKKIGVYLDKTYMIDYMAIDEYFNFLNHVFKPDTESFNFIKEELIQMLQVDINNKQLINQLSEGNQVKTGIIGSLLHNPKLVIWDEPFANLDAYARSMLIKIILKFNKENGTSFIISSHNIDELYEYSDHFLCLKDGNVIANSSKKHFSKNEILENLGVIKTINKI